jgi:hypothetical protein
MQKGALRARTETRLQQLGARTVSDEADRAPGALDDRTISELGGEE